MRNAERVAPIGAQPLALFAQSERVVARRKGRAISADDFAAHATQIAAALPERRYLINTCSDRYLFAVGLTAAMLRGQASLLPPSTAPHLLGDLAADYPGLYALTDDAAAELSIESLVIAESRPARTAATLAFAEDQIAAIAFTSGSSGRPSAHVKTWGGLVRGAYAAARQLGVGDMRGLSVVATVPAQHMYGLESSVILPLCNGGVLHEARPFYPDDVRAALTEISAERVLVTTPIHLRSLIDSGIDLPALRMIVCATAPLGMELARAVETRFATPVNEIYGFTEAGQVATRRTLHGPQWTLLPEIYIQMRDGCAWVHGGPIEREVASSDVIELIDERRFILHGRSADMVNIGGKRTSLAYLSQQLCALEGVRDGVVFFPQDCGAKVARPAALVVAPTMTRTQVLHALRQRIDAVFLPRPLHLVDALPRNPTGKLPRAALLRLIERCAVAAAKDRPREHD